MKHNRQYLRIFPKKKSSASLPAMGLAAGVCGIFVLPASAESEITMPHSHHHSHPGKDVHTSASWMDHPGLTSDWSSVHASLEDKGIAPYATYIGEIYNHHSGGIDTGSAWAGLLDFGVELDLEKLAGWRSTTFFVSAFYFHGDDISGDQVGDFNAVTNLYTDTSFNFYNIFFQKAFDGGNSFFKIGQIALDDDFMVSESSLLFLNAGFGPLPVQSGNTAAPIYSLAAPGAVVHYAPTGQWFVQAGIYTGDAGPAVSNNQGFDWNTGSASGWMFLAETGFKYGEEDGSTAKLGGFYHSGEYTCFADGTKENGIYTIYGVIDHQIVRAADCPGLNVFLRGGITPDDNIATVTAYVDAGVIVNSIFMEDDALGIAVSWTDLSDGAAVGGRSSEIVAELTYQIPVTDWFVLQPDLQYIINPQGGGGDAFLTGLRAELSF